MPNMDWVVNGATYGTSATMSVNDVLWTPLTFEQNSTSVETGNVQPWAHHEPSRSLCVRIRGQFFLRLANVWDDTINEGGILHSRIVRNRMDPLTQEPGLPSTTFYNLNNAQDANDDFLWEHKEQFHNVTGWFSSGASPPIAVNVPVDVKVKRLLEPPQQLWLVHHWEPLPNFFDPPRITVDPYIRTLISK